MMERLVSSSQRTLTQLTNFRNRRAVLLICGVCLLLYIVPSIVRVVFRRRAFPGDFSSSFDVAHEELGENAGGAGVCLQATLSEFHRMAEDNEVSLWSDRSSNSNYKTTADIPSVGNGYVALTVEKAQQSTLIIKRSSAESATAGDVSNLITNLDILSRARIGGESHNNLPTVAAYMTLFRSGAVKQYTYYGHAFGQCLEIEQEVIAHRVYPWLIVQSFMFRNNLPHAVEIRLENNTMRGSMLADIRHTNRAVYFAGGLVFSTVLEKLLIDRYAVVLAQTEVSSRFTLQTSETKSVNIFTVIQYASLSSQDVLKRGVLATPVPAGADLKVENSRTPTADAADAIRRQLEHEAQTKLQILLKSASSVDLLRLHHSAWQLLTRSTFGIARSRAVDALNGDRLNVTRYEVLSSVRFPQIELDTYEPRARIVDDALELTHKPISIENLDDACFSSHPTLLSTKLWSTSTNTRELLNKVKLWLLTLKKQGCDKLITAGAYGANHAFLLSLGGLRFKSNHLEMNVHPSELHRNMQLSRLLFDNNTYCNISVRVDEESNKAFLYVSAEKSQKQLYACDGGCLDAPVEIGPTPVQLPLKLTEPLTAVLYVAADRAHIEELKHTLHLRQVHEADPHPHHIIAEHKHGHHLGGLPASFWISIGLFVVLFHLFLIRILMNECAKPTVLAPERRRFRYYAS